MGCLRCLVCLSFRVCVVQATSVRQSAGDRLGEHVGKREGLNTRRGSSGAVIAQRLDPTPALKKNKSPAVVLE